ncbi:PadR family transcriptional regulator [Ktedonospora formicarum]|uniref:Transcriptional regulator n=1 Tax=Ktedonospora formicarum TaxID=2778364 RepID=A0A8J3MVL4_9CHLR|nr:PadR family transcriptional regulator [Ktedonospora formicarum]GHO47788.1 transcriptional regulator [Ktedonospora formicarum]
MSPVRYALLSLLAREPLTGYDLAQLLNARIAPFWPVRYNQIYPELARLEEEGLLKHHAVESTSYRPTKKVYEMTAAGREALREWVLLPVEPTVMRDEFLLKIYNLWLLEPEETIHQLHEQRALHAERAKAYEEHLEEVKIQMGPNTQNHRDPLFASIAVIEAGMTYERQYVVWCDHVLSLLASEVP